MSVFLPLLLTSLAVAVIELILPEGASSRMAVTIRALSGLCVLAALISPIREGIFLLRALASGDPQVLTDRLESVDPVPELSGTLQGTSGYEGQLSASLAATGADAVEAWVIQALETQFGIPPSRCQVRAAVTIRFTNDPDMPLDATITDVWIDLTGSALLRDPHLMEAWFENQLKCTCTVIQ